MTFPAPCALSKARRKRSSDHKSLQRGRLRLDFGRAKRPSHSLSSFIDSTPLAPLARSLLPMCSFVWLGRRVERATDRLVAPARGFFEAMAVIGPAYHA